MFLAEGILLSKARQSQYILICLSVIERLIPYKYRSVVLYSLSADWHSWYVLNGPINVEKSDLSATDGKSGLQK